jgi:hypothetical protein
MGNPAAFLELLVVRDDATHCAAEAGCSANCRSDSSSRLNRFGDNAQNGDKVYEACASDRANHNAQSGDEVWEGSVRNMFDDSAQSGDKVYTSSTRNRSDDNNQSGDKALKSSAING